MVEVNGLVFDTSLGVLFALREAGGHKTLQETYAELSHSDMDSVVKVMRISHEKGQHEKLSEEEFLEKLGRHNIGLVKLTHLYAEVSHKLMFSGMSEEEIAEAKKLAMERSRG